MILSEMCKRCGWGRRWHAARLGRYTGRCLRIITAGAYTPPKWTGAGVAAPKERQ